MRGESGTCSFCGDSPLANSSPAKTANPSTCRLCAGPLQPVLMPTKQTFGSHSLQFRSECKLLLLVCLRFGLGRDVRELLVKTLSMVHHPVSMCQLQTESESVKMRWFSDGVVIFCHLLCIRDCKIDAKVFSAFPLLVGRWKLDPPTLHNSNGCNGVESQLVTWRYFVAGETAFLQWNLELAFQFLNGPKCIKATRCFNFDRHGAEEVHVASVVLENNVKPPIQLPLAKKKPWSRLKHK